jgi:hypothetical protein
MAHREWQNVNKKSHRSSIQGIPRRWPQSRGQPRPRTRPRAHPEICTWPRIEPAPSRRSLLAAKAARRSTPIRSRPNFPGQNHWIHNHQLSAICFAAPAHRTEADRARTKSSDPVHRGPNARNCGHSSPAGTVSTGPSALYRRSTAVRSSVRSHHIVGSQPNVPRRHHCRRVARCEGKGDALRSQVGRMFALGLADRRIWTV